MRRLIAGRRDQPLEGVQDRLLARWGRNATELLPLYCNQNVTKTRNACIDVKTTVAASH